MDYKTLRKNYRLYIRSAGLICWLVGNASDYLHWVRVQRYPSSDGWPLIGPCRLVFISPLAQEELYQQVQHLAPCRLRFSFLAAIPSVEQECEKAHFTDRY